MTESKGFLSRDEKNEHGIFSDPIDKCTARELIDNYETSVTTNAENPIPLKTSDNRAVRGFYFDIEHVKKLVDMSESNDIKEIYFGVAQYSHGNSYHTFVMYGVDSSGTLLEMDDAIFDYTELCPTRCPERTEDICPPKKD